MMASDHSETHTLLQAGIAAVQRRDYARGRDLLLQAVEQDDQLEQAWMWLSVAVEDPHDQIVALENVLTINPGNVQAQKRLVKLKEQRGESAPVASAAVAGAADDPWKKYLPEAPLEVNDNIDDPLQCVYCGRMTRENDHHCPHCGKSLYRRVRRSDGSDFLKLAILLMGVHVAIGLVLSVGPAFRIGAGQEDPFGLKLLLSAFGVEPLLGNFLQLAPVVAWNLIYTYGARLGVFVLILLGLTQRWTLAYYGAILSLIADLGLNIFLLTTGYLGAVGCVINLLFDLGIMGVLFTCYPEFAINDERLLTKPDTMAGGAPDFYKRGHFYSKRGMWSLAVAQWRKAVGLSPKEVLYYKDLGIGYARLQRYQRSLRVLEEAQRQAPSDRTIAALIRLIGDQAVKEARPKA